ncbi:MAG: TRAP transporter large permease subunit, partial [Desulfarculus sp.]|nr:TRAP transporter large permease subunit [Desulfarculus sp.]
LIAGSTVLGHFFTITEIPMMAADWLSGLPLPPFAIMSIIFLIYIIGGSFIDDLAFMILATPILFPVATKLGYDPVWFGIMIGITIMIGVIIPPVAICVFIVKAISGVPEGVIYKGAMPFLLSLFVGAILLFIFPGLATWLPSLFMS